MVYECERCGCKAISTRTFRYCVHCEFKVNELKRTWTDTVDDLTAELKDALCEMFDTLEDDMAYVRHIKTVTFLEQAFGKINRHDYYDRQFTDIYDDVVEPSNQEMSDRNSDMLNSYYERKLMESRGN